MQTLPLIRDADMDSIIAWRGATPVTRATFLGHVRGMAERLPDVGHVLNLCKDRYWFSVGLMASISRGILSIMPNAVAPDLIAGLREEFAGLVCLSDQPLPFSGLPWIPVADSPGLGTNQEIPRIAASQHILCMYTSGSTGKPRGHLKTFAGMWGCATGGAGHVRAAAGGDCNIVGTVPFQHMYGIETTVFLPLQGGGSLTSRLPFFPADVAAALAEVPAPRLLATTPFHLRKLIESATAFPPVAAVLLATAPLSQELARQAEARFKAPVMEIYGSTETGQLATRQPARGISWRLYDGIGIAPEAGGFVATGGHLEGPQLLNDLIEIEDADRFRLLGRNSDIVNVAGKRNSLGNLNQILLDLPGVSDGVFCLPPAAADEEVTRLAAFVVAPTLNAQHIQAALRQKLDPVFLPRPLIFLETLPRDANGKLTVAALADLMARHLT
ncbi:MAG: AMP-binding protein [Azonexus sp.]|jgi:acyl-coenzyme A synthetase/AMP-(fatty) acid ligase|nr:AMP-binding protein [Azonexus sp.]